MPNPSYNLTGANRFRLVLGGERFRNNSLELQVNSVTMPGMSTGITEVNSPMRPIPQPGGTINFDELYINFILSEDLREWIFLFDWIREINFGSDNSMTPYYCTGELIILTNKFNPLLSFTFHNMFPTLLGTIDYTQDISSMDTMSSSSSFKFTDMTRNLTL
jgi:hypothetical protein